MKFEDIIAAIPRTPFYKDEAVCIFCADNRDILPSLLEIDACVTDPPYGLSFMGKACDYDVPQKETWQLVLNALKSGVHLLSFFGTRTYHRGVVAIEDAGFEIRDMVEWIYGSGFPKSHNVAGGIDKLKGFPDRGHRIATANRYHPDGTLEPNGELLPAYEAKSTEAQQWQGWGTALKPAHEPIVVARKPLIGTVAQNVLEYGTGGINIDECRVGTNGETIEPVFGGHKGVNHGSKYGESDDYLSKVSSLGRFPANLIHDGSDEVLACFPKNAEGCKPHIVNASDETAQANKLKGWGSVSVPKNKFAGFDDSGSAARFFYCAKASKSERNMGCEGLELKPAGNYDDDNYEWDITKGHRPAQPRQNNHPTVKPIALMEYLIKLVTPPNGIILDPFGGSGSTAVAAKRLGFKCILIEKDEKSCEIAAKRCQQNFQPELIEKRNSQGVL